MNVDWRKELLKDSCLVFDDGNWIESKDQSSEGIRLVQTGNIGFGFFKDKEDKSRFISEETFKRLKCTEILPGDLLVSRLPDPVGKSCIIPHLNTKMITGVDCTIIRTKEYLKPEFLRYFQMSETYLKDVDSRVTGTTRSRISRKNLGLVKIPIPPLSEQKAIVAQLDKAFTAIDQAKANIEKNIRNTKEFFQTKLNHIFLQNNENSNFEIVKLGGLGTITSSKRIYKNEYVTQGIPFYRTKEIKELSNNKEITIELFISELRYNEIKKQFGVPMTGDILMSAVGTIGEILVIENENQFYFKDGNIVWFKDFDKVNSFYLKYLLKTFVENLKSLAKGAAYSALTIEKIKEYEVSIPKSLQTQQQIVTQLDQLQEQTNLLVSKYEQKLANLEELRKSILEKAFKGELTHKSVEA